MSLVETVWRVLEVLKAALSYDPAVPVLGIDPKGVQSVCSQEQSKIQNQPKCSSR